MFDGYFEEQEDGARVITWWSRKKQRLGGMIKMFDSESRIVETWDFSADDSGIITPFFFLKSLRRRAS